MMSTNHALDQVDSIIEVDSTVDDDPTIDVAMQINTQGDVQEGRGVWLWQSLVCFGKWVLLTRKWNHTCNMATTKHYVPDEPLTIDKVVSWTQGVDSSHAGRVWLFDYKWHMDIPRPTKGKKDGTFQAGL